jgi:hypothetical protein
MGTESIQRKITGNGKENITAITSVTAAEDELPLQFITTDETICIETTQIGSVDEY